MGLIKKIKDCVRSIPEFSEKNNNIVGYVFAALITIAGLFLIYEVVTTDALVFKANWNMFKSPLGHICWFIGFIWAMLWWGKFTHWSATPVVETRDCYGNLIERKENYDVTEQMFAKWLMPLLGHFVIEPLMYGAIIYYPIQCIIALVGAIFPYILSLIVLGIIVGAWLFSRTFQFRYHSVVLVILGILFTVAFAWGAYAIGKNVPGSTIQMLTGDAQPSFTSNGDATHEFDETAAPQGEGDEVYEDEEDQFAGYGEEGLLGSLPDGTLEYVGDMEDYPIEFTIIKTETSDLKAVFKNVKYGTSMNLDGESLPADGGNINFYGKDGNNDWYFNLTGDASNITGTAQSGESKLKLSLNKK